MPIKYVNVREGKRVLIEARFVSDEVCEGLRWNILDVTRSSHNLLKFVKFNEIQQNFDETPESAEDTKRKINSK